MQFSTLPEVVGAQARTERPDFAKPEGMDPRKRMMMINMLQRGAPGQMSQGGGAFEGLTNVLGKGIAGAGMGQHMGQLFPAAKPPAAAPTPTPGMMTSLW